MTPLQALQRVLAGEHAAVYVFGVLGGRVSVSERPDLASRLAASYTTHRGRRDQLTAMIDARGAVPVAAQVSYRLPNAAVTPDQLTAAALTVERRCAAVYAEAVGSTSRADRRWAVAALTHAAVSELAYGGPSEDFPGVAEL